MYPWYASVGGAFGYWLIGVEDRQIALLTTRRDELLERRQKRKARERVEREESGVEAVS